VVARFGAPCLWVDLHVAGDGRDFVQEALCTVPGTGTSTVPVPVKILVATLAIAIEPASRRQSMPRCQGPKGNETLAV